MTDLFDNWIYENNADNSARFVLGEKGKNPLICIGVNPSTAEPGKLDKTLIQVRNRAKRMGFDGWIMLNIYPQRATNPDKLHRELDPGLKACNRVAILQCLAKYERLTIWAAWGTLIRKRGFLAECLKDIVWWISTLEGREIDWITVGKRSQKGDPHHPLYLSKDAKSEQFFICDYLEGLGK